MGYKLKIKRILHFLILFFFLVDECKSHVIGGNMPKYKQEMSQMLNANYLQSDQFNSVITPFSFVRNKEG